MPEKDTVYPDGELKKGIVEAFGNLRLFAKIVDINYSRLCRVVNERPCSQDDIHLVLEKWQEFGPEWVHPRAEAILSRGPTKNDFRWLYNLYLHVTLSLAKK